MQLFFLLDLKNRLIFPVEYCKKENILLGLEFFFKCIPYIIAILLLFVLPLILELLTVLRYCPPE